MTTKLNPGNNMAIKENQNMITNHKNSEVLKDNSPWEIIPAWLRQEKSINDKLIFRVYAGVFVEYDGTCYREVPRKSVYNQIESFLLSKFYKYGYYREDNGDDDPNDATKPFNPTPTLINEIIEHLPAYCEIKSDALDNQPFWLTDSPDNPIARHLISFRNGLLDFDQYLKGKMVVYKHSPDLFVASSLPYDFNPDAHSETWDYIIESGLFGYGRKKIQLLSQWMGYNLMPGLSYDMLLILTGKSGPAKDLIIDTMQAMLGYSNCLTTSFQAIAGHRGYRTLFGKSSIVVKDSDTPTKRVPGIALDKIMQVVKNRPVNIDPNSPNLVKLPCKFTVVTDNVPIFSAGKRNTLDYYTRILTLNESHDEERRPRLRQALIEDAESGKLINVALRGLASLLQEPGGFVGLYDTELSPSVVGPRSVPMASFVADYIVPDPSCRVSTDDLYTEWIKFCEKEGINAGAKNVFVKNFWETLPDLKMRKPLIYEKRVKVFMGIRPRNYKRSRYVAA